MSCKKEVAYLHAFKYIEENITTLAAEWFLTDFELAIRNALGKLHPTIDRFTCWFHQTQAVRRKATQLSGFVDFIKSNKTAEKVYRKCLCLPLLPAAQIEPAYRTLEKIGNTAGEQNFKEFFNYFENQWLRREKPENYSVFKKKIRTSSAVPKTWQFF